ncbi:hypothetical protein [Spirosoma sordidisoli]|uniref:Uncharacterized protein n=1 Tax=Spirosoma sordidisoli TaxID=2502893 RepID=A0A4Q2UI47_9BACT|nr:hypothetical protein [Spirosoma sordidisoli]RYC67175.1 hypothetical protein EQG79_26225 [Spirosoma sordidisoli]
MEKVLGSMHIDIGTLCWLAALGISTILYSFAEERINHIHQAERQHGADETGQYAWIHRLSLLSNGIGLLSLVALAYLHPLQFLVVLPVLFILYRSRVTHRIGVYSFNVLQQARRWSFTVQRNPIRIGLLGAGSFGLEYALEEEYLVNCLAFSNEPTNSVISLIVSRAGQAGSWEVLNGFVMLGIMLTGSAFWQAHTRINHENQSGASFADSSYSWRTDSLLLSYLFLLVSLLGLTAVISFSAISNYTFWIGYLGVILAQRTKTGRRLGQRIVYAVESFLVPADRVVE